jgi:cytochrome c556
MTPSKPLAAILVFGAVLIAGASAGEALQGAAAAKARMAHMKALGKASKAVFEQVKTGAPDMAVVKVEAAHIALTSRELPSWFPPGSGQEAEPKSHALPVVWTEHVKFETKAKALADAAAKLDAVAQAGDAAGVGSAFHDVGAACKGCHETFKAKDED